MDGMTMLDALIGLVFVYATLSMIVTAAGEVWSQQRNLRGVVLKNAIDKLLGKELSDELYRDPIIEGLKTRKKGNPPSYIPNETFSAGLAATLFGAETPQVLDSPKRLQHSLPEMLSIKSNSTNARISPEAQLVGGGQLLARTPSMVATLSSLSQKNDFDKAKFFESIERQFQDAMDRLTGEFKRKLSRRLIFIGVILAAALNVNTIHMYQQLTDKPELRAAFVDKAIKLAEDNGKQTLHWEEFCPVSPEDGEGSTTLESCTPFDLAKQQALQVMPLIGWTRNSPPLANGSGHALNWCENPGRAFLWLLYSIAGWLITAVALSLGAPFWFDTLQRLVNIRGSLQPAKAKGDSNSPEDGAAGSSSVPTGPPPLDPEDLDTVTSFEPATLRFNTINAFWSARLSELSYQDAPIAQGRAQTWGASANLVQGGEGTQVLLVDAPDCLFVAFRGTELDEVADIITDIKIELVKPAWAEPGVEVHKGFLEALDSTWDLIEPAMAESTDQGKRIVLCGHSLGGALAVLSAHRLLIDGLKVNTAKRVPQLGPLYTFGQPRVGNLAFANELEQLIGAQYYRSVNNRDAVPLVPPPNMGYAHAGSVLYFNEFGSFIKDPPAWYRGLDKLTMDKSEIKSVLKQTGGDHAMAFYLRLQGSLLGMPSDG